MSNNFWEGFGELMRTLVLVPMMYILITLIPILLFMFFIPFWFLATLWVTGYLYLQIKFLLDWFNYYVRGK